MARRKKTTAKKVSRSRTSAPLRRSCACMHVHFRLCDQHPEFRTQQIDIEGFTSRCMLLGEARRRTTITKIPVVVHVVYNTPSENISDAQIKSQIAVLKKDFRATNADRSKVPAAFKPFVADARVEFHLAKKDPNGATTAGITRTRTERTSFGSGDTVKSNSGGGVDPWPTDRYLNIWVCSLGGGLLGYAQFPGGPAETDGVVILNRAFGTKGTAVAPFNKGRTTTHEFGHWLNLRHIWGDTNDCGGSDFVDDTPLQQLPNYDKPAFPHVSCMNAPNGDMFMNYMDYVDDAAMFMFSQGQVERIRACLMGPRSSFNDS